MLIYLNRFDAQEKKTLQCGNILCGLHHDGSFIVLLWQVLNEQGWLILSGETVFITGSHVNHLLARHQLQFQRDPTHRFLIHLVAVDAADKEVKVMRSLMLPDPVNQPFLSAWKNQIHGFNADEFHIKRQCWRKKAYSNAPIMFVFLRLPPRQWQLKPWGR